MTPRSRQPSVTASLFGYIGSTDIRNFYTGHEFFETVPSLPVYE